MYVAVWRLQGSRTRLEQWPATPIARSGHGTLCWVASSRDTGRSGSSRWWQLFHHWQPAATRRPVTTEPERIDRVLACYHDYNTANETSQHTKIYSAARIVQQLLLQSGTAPVLAIRPKDLPVPAFADAEHSTACLPDWLTVQESLVHTDHLICNFRAHGVNCICKISEADFQTNWITCHSKLAKHVSCMP